MTCDAIIPSQPSPWVEAKPFMLWDIGPRNVLEHWMDTLFRSNVTLRIWLESQDELLYNYICETYPLNRRVNVQTGRPSTRAEACTFLDSKGNIIIRRGPQLTPYLPKQPASRTWFAMVKKWLDDLRTAGSQSPELEKQISPGVFVGHHCDISRDTTLIAPCWVGSGCTIRGSSIGPYTVVADDCVITPGSSLAQTVLTKGTRAGPCAMMSGLVVGPAGMIAHNTGAHLKGSTQT